MVFSILSYALNSLWDCSIHKNIHRIVYATSCRWKISLLFWGRRGRSISCLIGLLLFRLGSCPPWRSSVGSLIRDCRRALVLGCRVVRGLARTLIWGLRGPLNKMSSLALARKNQGFLPFFAYPWRYYLLWYHHDKFLFN